MKYAIGIIISALLLVGGWYIVFGQPTIPQDSAGETESLAIATSFYPLQFALEQIVGEHGVVTNIGAGRDPHDFSPSTQDILTLQRADVVVLQGADFEPWGDDVMTQLEASDIPVIIATANLTLHEGGHDHDEDKEKHEDEDEHHDEDEHSGDQETENIEEGHEDEHMEAEHEDEHEHGAYDPHTWLDPVLFSQTIEHLAAEIIAIDPDNAAAYETNTAALLSELEVLATAYSTRLATCELDEVITSHDAFGYVADRYNFSIHSIAGLSTQDSPSATILAELREEAEEGIGAILLEDNSITAYGETLARETGLVTLSINPIAYSIPTGETYLTLMQSNLDMFATALTCNG